MANTYKYILDFVGNNRQFIQTIDQNERKLKEMDGSVGSSKSKMDGFFGDMGKQVLALGSFAAVTAGAKLVIGNMIDVRSEFEKYEAVLTTSLGSQRKSAEAMGMLQKFAATTPFQLNELTGAYVKLTNYGLKPNMAEMVKYGDLASSVGKGFDQLVEAVADAVTGEYERLKEFGIKAQASGDKVVFTFKEQKTTVENNSAAIKNYILGLGELNGVQGSMSSISKTLGGEISNLKDNWDALMNSMGSKSSGVMSGVISFFNDLLSRTNKLVKGDASVQDRKNSLISDFIGDLPKDKEEAKKKIETNLTDLKSWIQKTQGKLNAELSNTDFINVLFGKEHVDRINFLRETLQVYEQTLKELPSEYKKEIDSEKAAEEQKKKNADAANLKKASLGGLSDQLKTLNEDEAKVVATNKEGVIAHYKQVAAIEYRIQENEKLKKSIAELYADEQTGVKKMKLTMLISKQSPMFDTNSTDNSAGNLTDTYSKFIKQNNLEGYKVPIKLDVEDMQKNMPIFQKNMERVKKEFDKLKEKSEMIGQAVGNGFAAIGQSVVASFGLAAHGMEGFVGKMGELVTQIIAMAMASSVAYAIEQGSLSALGTGFLAAFTGPAFIALAVGRVMSAFAAIPAFADGGIVYGPTMGVMGEYPGARSNPEIIAPLSKLQAIIGGGGSANIILQPGLDFDGDKMRIYLKRLEAKANKRTGN
jgi:hypothetical protein